MCNSRGTMVSSVLTLAFLLVLTNCQELTKIGEDSFSNTFVPTPSGSFYLWEISGLSHNNDASNPIFYGVSDTILYEDNPEAQIDGSSPTKSFFVFDLDISGSTPSLAESDITSVEIEDADSTYTSNTADTESIAYIEQDGTGYLILATEGYRDESFDSRTNFWLYDTSGSFIKALDYNEAIFMEEGTLENPTNGFQDGDGPESMSVTSDYSYVIWIASNTLVQDTGCTDKCVRISLNSIDSTGSEPDWYEIAQYRYDKEAGATVSDAVILDSDLSTVLVLEKTDIETDNAQGGTDTTYDLEIYAIDLSADFNMSIADDYDISDCDALTNTADCANYANVLPKTLVYSESNSIYDIDALSTGTGAGCEEDEVFVLGATDNGEETNTYILYFCYDANVTTVSDDDAAGKVGIEMKLLVSMVIAIMSVVLGSQ